MILLGEERGRSGSPTLWWERRNGEVLLRRKRRRARGAFEEFEASRRVLLACRGCAERLVLLGLEIDWRKEGRSTFTCGGCGTLLTFADRLGTGRPDPSGSRRPVPGR